MEDVIKLVQSTFSEHHNVVTACAIGVLTIFLIFILFGRKSKRNSVLLTGLCDSGKTALFTLLTTGDFKATHTSILENQEQYFPSKRKSGKSLMLIDTPGHQRVRNQFLEKYSSQIGSVIFMVDSATFTRELRDVAECMYDILACKAFAGARCPILVCCNKQDLPTARGLKVVQSQLETELTALRQTKGAALKDIDEQSSSQCSYIGKKDKPFEFSHVHPVKVTFIECSVKGENGTPEISNIQDWLGSV